MKRKLLIIVSILVIVLIALCLTACDKEVKFDINFIVDNQNYAVISTYGSEVIQMPQDPTKDYYEFDGWYWDNNVWEKPFTANSLMDTPLSSNMNVYAKWTAIEYTASFKVDGQIVGTRTYTMEDNEIANEPSVPNKNGYDGVWENYTIKAGGIMVNAIYTAKQYTISYSNTKDATNSNVTSYSIETKTFTLSDLSKEGYTFDGWYNDLTKVSKIDTGSLCNLTLEARWTPIVYTITYKNTKSAINTNVTSYSIETETFTLSDLSKEGYTFDGWYNDLTKVSKIDTGSFGDLTLEARWTPIVYTITYKNTKSAINTNVTSHSIETETFTLSDLSKEGYMFDGWYNGLAKVSKIEKGSYGNLTLIAKWTPITYTITYINTKNATNTNTTNFTIETQPIVLSDVSALGYIFDGWYNGLTKVSKIDTGSFGDLTLEARWTPIVYTITYNNTKSAINTNVTSYSIETETFDLTNLSKEGYTFDAWYDGSNRIVEILKGSYGDKEFEAKWTTIEYTASFKVDGQIVGTRTYTMEDNEIANEPSVPNKNGYDGVWENYTIKAGGIMVNAIYTAKQYTISYSNTKDATNSNVTSYSIETKTFTLSDLSKEGYTFDGWYNDLTKVSKIDTGSLCNLTLEARWTAIEYTATFKADGQTVGTAKYTMEDNEIANEPSVPNKNGYDGVWENYALKVGGITVNAIYTAKQYTITWKNNDGTILKTTKCEFNKIPSYGSETPTKKSDSQYNYTFNGWAPEIAVATEDTIYIATYTKTQCTSYKITYDANGGSNAPSTQNKTKGSSVKLSSTIPTNGDHVFMGWNCANDGKTYNAGSSFNVDANVTLYAIWGHECETCHGDGNVSNTKSCTKCSGSGKYANWSQKACPSCKGAGKYKQETSCNSCSGTGKAGYYTDPSTGRPVFYGTCSSCGGSGKGYTDLNCTSCNGRGVIDYIASDVCSTCSGKGTITKTNTCSTCSGNKNLIDKYNSYTVYLKNNGNSVGTSTVTINSPYKLTVPTKNGYTFLGWFDANKDGVQYTDGEGVSLSTWKESSNKTLYAYWSLNYYTITYDCDSFVDISNMSTVYTVEDANINLNVQNREYYTFVWKLDNVVITEFDTSLAKDVVIKGIWTPIEYTITYDLDGGDTTNPKSHNVETDTFTLTDPMKEGYAFIGWIYDGQSTPTKEVVIYKGSVGNRIFTANWQINQYTIQFVTNGGSPVSSITQDYGTELNIGKPVLNEKSFAGWFDSTLTMQYDFATMPAQNITLYAKWIDYEVTLSLTERTEISVNNAISAETFYATAVDTDGNPVEVTAQLIGGTKAAGNTITVRLVAEGLYGLYDIKTVSGIKVYGTPVLTYDTEKDFIKLSDTLGATLFSATAKDTFDGDLNVEVTVKEDFYEGGDLVTVIISVTDNTGNKTEVEISNVKVYDLPLIMRDTTIVDIKAYDTIGNELFGVSAVDSFGEPLTVTTTKYSGTFSGGNTIMIKSQATDSKGNTNYITYSVKVFGLPSIAGVSKTSFKVEDVITLESLGIVAKDSFGTTLLGVSLELTSGTQSAGATLTYLVTATDHLGNVNTREINGIKIYGAPTITYNTEKINMKVTDSINAALLSTTAKDSHNGDLSVTITLNSGMMAGGNVVTFKLSATDALGNVFETVSQNIKVYSAEDMTMTWTTATNNARKNSDGSEFNTIAIDSFGEPCTVHIEAAEGYTLAGGNTINLYLVATDAADNIKTSDLIYNIKIYDTPILSYKREQEFIYPDDSPYALFSVKDSFGSELLFDAEVVSGTLTPGSTITYRITAKDKEKNPLSVEYTLYVLEKTESLLRLYIGDKLITEQKVVKNTKYTLPTGYYWIDNGIVIAGPDGKSLVPWCKDSGIYTIASIADSDGVVVIFGDVQDIGTTYQNNANIKELYICDGVSEIPNNAFSGCKSLKKVVISDGVTSIGGAAFSGCSSLTSITIPDSVTSIGGAAFIYCYSLTSITLPDGVTSIGAEAFSYCSSLTSITIPDSVTRIGVSAFWNCNKLTSITLPFIGAAEKGSTNTNFGYIFSGEDYSNFGSDSVKTVVITKATSIGDYAFRDCSSLTSITIPDSVTSIGKYAFKRCGSLTSITIPDSVTSIGAEAFRDCSSLTSITIPDKVTRIGDYAFSGCSSLTSITIPDSVTSIGAEAFRDCSSLTSITLPDGVTSIGDYAFSGCSSLTSITILDKVTRIGDYAFSGCNSLTNITIPDSVTSIGKNAFSGCSSLTSITIPDKVTSIGGAAFSGCSSLTSITLSDDVTSIGDYAFMSCHSLTSITLPDCVTSIGDYAFIYCYSLTSITLPVGVTSIGAEAFRDCSSLTSITIPDSVTSIGKYAFKGCDSLTSITIPDSVTSIGVEAFSGCSSLTNITIPDSVTSIGAEAFRGCSSLTIYCKAASKPSGWSGNWNLSGGLVVWNYK